MKLLGLFLLKVVSVISINTASVPGDKCPDADWVYSDGFCYLKSTSVASFETAKHDCDSMDATLVSIENSDGNTVVDLLSGNTNVWIGLFKPSLCEQSCDLPTLGIHIGWEWKDDTSFSYSNWLLGEPDQLAPCAIMRVGGYWQDTYCNENCKFVCEEATKTELSYYNALAVCEALNVTLVTIANQDENSFVESLIGGDETWIGLYNSLMCEQEPCERYFGWGWSDNTSVSYTNWFPTEPDDGEPCAIRYYNGQWRDRPCSYTFEYICEKRESVNEATSTKSVATTETKFTSASTEEVQDTTHFGSHIRSITLKTNIMTTTDAIQSSVLGTTSKPNAKDETTTGETAADFKVYFASTKTMQHTAVTDGTKGSMSWNSWNRWSECSKKCGGGWHTKSKICSPEKRSFCKFSLMFNGYTIWYDIYEELCNIRPCAIDGSWEEWMKWGRCSGCEKGTRQRRRSCDGPFYGGHPCNGTGYQTEICQANCSAGFMKPLNTEEKQDETFLESDERVSAVAMGTTWIIVLVTISVLILLLDLPNIYTQIRFFWCNNRGKYDKN